MNHRCNALICSPAHNSRCYETLLLCHELIELASELRKSNVRQASYLGLRLASFDKNNDGRISIGELGQ